jgi:REP element-mobilizing transposase RayT/DNA-binding NarL/FixJ family response regulator
MVPKRVLILTPSNGFGGLISQLLEDAGGYKPFLISKSTEALEQARKEAVALIILDAELGDKTTPALVAELRELAPLAHLVIIPAEDNPQDPQLELMSADAILPSPFYLPDLVAVIEKFFGPLVAREVPRHTSYGDAPASVQAAPARQLATVPAWLEDVSQAAGYLTRLSLESASRAALITRGQQVWAYAGELPKAAADELAAAVADHTAKNNEADLARFIHLSATGVDYMLYATGLGSDYTLALAFDAQMPFSQMRAQVNQLAKALVTAPQQSISQPEEIGARSEYRSEARMQNGESEPPTAAPQSSMPQPEHPRLLPSLGESASAFAGPVASGIDLHYSYALIPRLPKHKLEGDLAEKLAEWLPELCLAFAWRLDRISIQPEFIQWTISMPPDASPESAAQTLDKHLSKNIFELFPQLARENPSGHFWAPGYLIVSASRPTSEQISEFIQRIRARQGVPR